MTIPRISVTSRAFMLIVMSVMAAGVSANNKSGKRNIFRDIFAKRKKYIAEESLTSLEVIEDDKHWPIVTAILFFVVVDIFLNKFYGKQTLSQSPSEEKTTLSKQPELLKTEIETEIQPELYDTPNVENISDEISDSKNSREEVVDNVNKEREKVGDPAMKIGATDVIIMKEETTRDVTDEKEKLVQTDLKEVSDNTTTTSDNTTTISDDTTVQSDDITPTALDSVVTEEAKKPRRPSSFKKLMKKSKRMITPIRTRDEDNGLPEYLHSEPDESGQK